MKSTSGPDFRSAPPPRRHLLIRALQFLLIVPFLVLLAMAVHFQLGGGLLGAAMLVLIAAAAIALARLWWINRIWSVWIGAAGLAVLAAIWWSTITPSNDRDWQVDVAHGVGADVQGNIATLTNVRNFDWRTDTDFTPHWETRTYDIDQITSVDLFTSVWSSPAIAHVLVSFGFADGQHVVFSAETRKFVGQSYSALGGFFRLYTLVLIAADERDIIRLRTDVRTDPREIVSIFPLSIRPEKRKELFLEYLSMADVLQKRPEFYNTLTTNCTTVVWRMARTLAPGIPLDWRVLASGYFPQYLHDLGVVSPGRPLDEVLRRAVVSPQGPALADGAEFSRRMRVGHEP